LLILKHECRPWPGGIFVSGGWLNQARFLPTSVFADRDTLPSGRKLDESGALARSHYPLTGAARKFVQPAPIVET
jgi:hypothetical protein